MRRASIAAARKAFEEKEAMKERKHEQEEQKRSEKERRRSEAVQTLPRRMSRPVIAVDSPMEEKLQEQMITEAIAERLQNATTFDEKHIIIETIIPSRASKREAAKGSWLRFATWSKTRLLSVK